MISFNRTFDEARSIRVTVKIMHSHHSIVLFTFQVLVVPIGDNSMFDKHFEIVSRIRL
jgi:hypothetical protein